MAVGANDVAALRPGRELAVDRIVLGVDERRDCQLQSLPTKMCRSEALINRRVPQHTNPFLRVRLQLPFIHRVRLGDVYYRDRRALTVLLIQGFDIDSLAPENLRLVLEKNQFKRFPVVEGERVIGCVTREEAAAAIAGNRLPVLEKAALCKRSQTIGEVARLLIEAPGGFAVLQAGDKPAGIITLHDLLRAQETLAARSNH